MLGVLKTWWPRKSFVFFLCLISPQRSRELTRMKQRLTRWLPARPHTCPLIVYTWNYLSCFAQLAASNQTSTAGFPEQKRYLSIHLKPYGHTPQLYSTCAPRTLHALRHTHTPYAHPMRTVHDSCAHRTRKSKPCSHHSWI